MHWTLPNDADPRTAWSSSQPLQMPSGSPADAAASDAIDNVMAASSSRVSIHSSVPTFKIFWCCMEVSPALSCSLILTANTRCCYANDQTRCTCTFDKEAVQTCPRHAMRLWRLLTSYRLLCSNSSCVHFLNQASPLGEAYCILAWGWAAAMMAMA